MEEESLPFDFPHFNEGKYHYPFYAFEVLSLYISAYDNMAVDLVTVSAISLIVVQLRILNKKLIDTELNVRNSPGFMEANMENDVLRYVEECCQHYCDIEKYVLSDWCFHIFCSKPLLCPDQSKSCKPKRDKTRFYWSVFKISLLK